MTSSLQESGHEVQTPGDLNFMRADLRVSRFLEVQIPAAWISANQTSGRTDLLKSMHPDAWNSRVLSPRKIRLLEVQISGSLDFMLESQASGSFDILESKRSDVHICMKFKLPERSSSRNRSYRKFGYHETDASGGVDFMKFTLATFMGFQACALSL